MKKLLTGIVATAALTMGGWALANETAPGTQLRPSADTSASASADQPAANVSNIGRVKHVDAENGYITVEIPIRKGVAITRDGKNAHIQNIQNGDEVRASFDPTTEQISKLDVESKNAKARGQ